MSPLATQLYHLDNTYRYNIYLYIPNNIGIPKDIPNCLRICISICILSIDKSIIINLL